MASFTFGTGRAQNCTTSGRHMMMCVLECCGTPMKRPRWPHVAGMGSSSTGTEVDTKTINN